MLINHDLFLILLGGGGGGVTVIHMYTRVHMPVGFYGRRKGGGVVGATLLCWLCV